MSCGRAVLQSVGLVLSEGLRSEGIKVIEANFCLLIFTF